MNRLLELLLVHPLFMWNYKFLSQIFQPNIVWLALWSVRKGEKRFLAAPDNDTKRISLKLAKQEQMSRLVCAALFFMSRKMLLSWWRIARDRLLFVTGLDGAWNKFRHQINDFKIHQIYLPPIRRRRNENVCPNKRFSTFSEAHEIVSVVVRMFHHSTAYFTQFVISPNIILDSHLIF